jgi:hypothetical protein
MIHQQQGPGHRRGTCFFQHSLHIPVSRPLPFPIEAAPVGQSATRAQLTVHGPSRMAVPSLLPVALAAVTAALLMCGGGVEARVLLTLDDFGAVGDGIANDTQVRAPSKHLFGFQLAGRREGPGAGTVDRDCIRSTVKLGWQELIRIRACGGCDIRELVMDDWGGRRALRGPHRS